MRELALVLIAVAAATRGPIAEAAESRLVTVTPGSNAEVLAILVPGVGHSEVCGRGGDGAHVDFRVAFTADGGILFNGARAGSYEPSEPYRVSVSFERIGSQFCLNASVTSGLTGALIATHRGHPIGSGPTQFSARAERVLALCVATRATVETLWIRGGRGLVARMPEASSWRDCAGIARWAHRVRVAVGAARGLWGRASAIRELALVRE